MRVELKKIILLSLIILSTMFYTKTVFADTSTTEYIINITNTLINDDSVSTPSNATPSDAERPESPNKPFAGNDGGNHNSTSNKPIKDDIINIEANIETDKYIKKVGTITAHYEHNYTSRVKDTKIVAIGNGIDKIGTSTRKPIQTGDILYDLEKIFFISVVICFIAIIIHSKSNKYRRI